MHKIHEIKTKAVQSETMVQEICRDIKKLDCAKRHITTTITALHRLTMLVSAVQQLQVMASKQQYKEASAQLEVRAGVEMALIDAVANSIRISLWRLFGGASDSVTTDITLPIVTLMKLLNWLPNTAEKGFKL